MPMAAAAARLPFGRKLGAADGGSSKGKSRGKGKGRDSAPEPPDAVAQTLPPPAATPTTTAAIAGNPSPVPVAAAAPLGPPPPSASPPQPALPSSPPPVTQASCTTYWCGTQPRCVQEWQECCAEWEALAQRAPIAAGVPASSSASWLFPLLLFVTTLTLLSGALARLRRSRQADATGGKPARLTTTEDPM